MNINSINTGITASMTNFGCSDPNCNCHSNFAPTPAPPKDTLEITKDVADKNTSFAKKVTNGVKNMVIFFKTNKKANVGIKAGVKGLMSACTVLYANEIIKKSIGTPPKGLAGGLATAAAVIVAVADIARNKNAISEKTPENK